MPSLITFELCAETRAACLHARRGGADRIELCTALAVGGLTPPPALVRAVVARSGVPVHVLLRPTATTFRSSPEIFSAIRQSLDQAKQAGAAGVVLGLLREDGRVDLERTRTLVALAHPLPVTFHRAFDATPDLSEALEDVIAAGCARVLTSGGAPDVLTGAPALARLVKQAGERIEVAVGGGLRLANAQVVAQRTGAHHFHASLRAEEPGMASIFEGSSRSLAARIRQLTQILRQVRDPESLYTESPHAVAHSTAGTGVEG